MDLNIQTAIETKDLKNSELNLVDWYRTQINELYNSICFYCTHAWDMRYYHNLRSLGKLVCQYEQEQSPLADRPEKSVEHGVKKQMPDLIELDSDDY